MTTKVRSYEYIATFIFVEPICASKIRSLPIRAATLHAIAGSSIRRESVKGEVNLCFSEKLLAKFVKTRRR